MDTQNFNKQLNLVVQSLPLVNWEKFSLKGGSAINLFYRPLSRISVDIDLTYRKITNRAESIRDISNELKILSDKINNSDFAKSEVTHFNFDKSINNKIVISSDIANIIVEPNFTIRGSVYGDSFIPMNQGAAELLGLEKDIKATVMSFEDVYAGKICAALDRQHPRDLYDARLLLATEGISEKTKDAFLIYVSFNNRTISELLNPNRIDQSSLFNNMFSTTTTSDFSYADFEATREKLIKTVHEIITEKDIGFLTSFSNGNPQWELLSKNIDVERIKSLPSIQWKLLNIAKMDPAKKSREVANIQAIFPKSLNRTKF